MVSPPERTADTNERRVGLLAREVGGDLARNDNFAVALRTAQLLNGHAVVFGDNGNHLLRLKDALRARIDRLAQYPCGELHRDRHAAEAAHSNQTGERPFKFAHIALHAAGDLLQHIIGHDHAALFNLAAQNGDPCLKIRRRDVCNQTPLKARAKALLKQ